MVSEEEVIFDGLFWLKGVQWEIRDEYFVCDVGLFMFSCVFGFGKLVIVIYIVVEDFFCWYVDGDLIFELYVVVVLFNRDEVVLIVFVVCEWF